MTKRKTEPKREPGASRTLHSVAKPGETREQLIAQIAAAGMLENAATVQAFGKGTVGEIGITEAVHALRERADAMSRGDLSGAEAMLAAQASSLNAIFAEMARRAAANMGEYLSATETYLRLALKAQAQCRATLETLATIKAGPVVIARQANIAHGPQQVNNGVSQPVRADARAGNSVAARSELLEGPGDACQVVGTMRREPSVIDSIATDGQIEGTSEA
jgi:hypothetical protein